MIREERIHGGDNWTGQLGNGTTIDSSVPICIMENEQIKDISAGGDWTTIIYRNGEIEIYGGKAQE